MVGLPGIDTPQWQSGPVKGGMLFVRSDNSLAGSIQINFPYTIRFLLSGGGENSSLSYHWDFNGNGDPFDGYPGKIMFPNPMNPCIVTLTIKDDSGNVSIIQDAINVEPMPLLQNGDAKIVPDANTRNLYVSDMKTPLQSIQFTGYALNKRADRSITCRVRIDINVNQNGIWNRQDEIFTAYITVAPGQIQGFPVTDMGQVQNNRSVRLDFILEPDEPMKPDNAYLDAKSADI